MQVTITLLPVSLSLVHIPRSRLNSLFHPVLRQILQPNPGFLNITCNEIELSIFAEHHMLHDFEPISRRDRHRQRSRSGSGSSRKPAPDNSVCEHVEISYEKWNVLQIDSHNDQIGTYFSPFFFQIPYSFSYISQANRALAFMTFQHLLPTLASLSSTSRLT